MVKKNRTPNFALHVTFKSFFFRMATYDSLGVPVLGFHNPAGSTFYPKGFIHVRHR